MKNFSFQKIILSTLLIVMPIWVFAQSNLSSAELVKQMQALLTQYSERIRVLEAENTMLRNLMAKYEIQIPLEEYTNIINSTGSITTAPSIVSQNTTTSSSGVTNQAVDTPKNTANLSPLRKGFVEQLHADWQGIRGAYNMPTDARIGGYEFVQDTTENHVYVDVIYGTGTADGAYSAKLLYEFDKTTFKRKLLGFFEYNEATKMYITKTGKNLFPGVERDIVRNETPAPVNTSSNNTSQSSTPMTPVINTTEVSSLKIENDMLAEYNKKDFTNLLKISDEYLKNNPLTYKIGLYRYRSYFRTRNFIKALEEIQKMENAKLANAAVYCEASVVAMYAKNTNLQTKYKNLAGAGCTVK